MLRSSPTAGVAHELPACALALCGRARVCAAHVTAARVARCMRAAGITLGCKLARRDAAYTQSQVGQKHGQAGGKWPPRRCLRYITAAPPALLALPLQHAMLRRTTQRPARRALPPQHARAMLKAYDAHNTPGRKKGKGGWVGKKDA